MSGVSVQLFDRAEYHEDSCVEAGLAPRQARVPTGLFVAWAHARGLTRPDFGPRWTSALMRWRIVRPSTLYFFWDGALADIALSDEGLRFVRWYFAFEVGSYLRDFERVLVRDAETPFHVADTWHNVDLIAPLLDARLAMFRGESVPMPPMPSARPDHV